MLGDRTLLPFAIDWSSLTSSLFLVNVGVLAGIYALLALGLQLNVGFTGITNFGQAGFMAIGGYTMAILTVDTGISFWLSLPLSMLAAMAFGLLVGLPSLRLRADYFAIATIASAEVIRIIAQNAQGAHRRQPGLLLQRRLRQVLRRHLEQRLEHDRRLAPGPRVVRSRGADAPALVVIVVRDRGHDRAAADARTRPGDGSCARSARTRTPPGRWARTRSPTSSSRWRSRPGSRAIAGWFLALDLATVHPTDFEPLVTFFAYSVLILGGLANYWGVIAGSIVLWRCSRATRFVELSRRLRHGARCGS